MRYSMVLTVLCLWISVGGLPVQAQAAKGPDSPTAYAAAQNARRQELEETARAASVAAENATDAKAREEALRQKRIAEIELEVARAAERRGVQPSTAPVGQVMAQTIVRPAAPEQPNTPQTETVREPARATTRAEARRRKEEQRLAVEKEKAARLEADLERTKEELVRKIKSEGTPAQSAPQDVVVKVTPPSAPATTAPAPASASPNSNPNSAPVLTVTPAGLAESRARMRELLDQKLEELKVPNPSKKAPAVASTKSEAQPAATPAVAVTSTGSPSVAVAPAATAAPSPTPTVIRAASLPTVQELEAEAKARRDRERQAAEQARQRVRDEELKETKNSAAATVVVATPERSPEPAAPARIETVVAAPQKRSATAEAPKAIVSRKPEAPVLTAAAQTTSSSGAAQTIVQAPAAPTPTAPLLQNEDALRRIADEADAADRKAREARQAMEEGLKRARATKPSIEPPQPAKEVKAPAATTDDSAKARSREESRIRAQMESRLKEEARQREKEEKARARELKKAAEKAGAPATPAASATPTISTPAPAVPTTSQPPVLSGSKEDKLKQLLESYRSGAINALDYHRERSKVLSQ